MRTLPQKLKASHKSCYDKPSIPAQALSKQNCDVHSNLHLHQEICNQAVQRLFQTNDEESNKALVTIGSTCFAHYFSEVLLFPNICNEIQLRLKVGTTGDPYELEADRIADQVIHMPDPQLQSASAYRGKCPKCNEKRWGKKNKQLQIKSIQTNGAVENKMPSLVQNVLSEPGHPLDINTRNFMTSRFGHDFSQVRVHTDPKLADSTRILNAVAYTLGWHIVFGTGQYVPNTRHGRHLLAHELTHVAQQAGNHTILQRRAAPVKPRPLNKREQEYFHKGVRTIIKCWKTYPIRKLVINKNNKTLERILDYQKAIVENTLRGIKNYYTAGKSVEGPLSKAYQNFVSALIKHASKMLPQTTHEIYQANRSRIHEWGWPKATKQVDATMLTATFRERERTRIKVITSSFSLEESDLNTWFAKKNFSYLPRKGLTFSLSASLQRYEPHLKRGLKSVAVKLIETKKLLSEKSTITLALDLEKYDGDYGAYRFTFYGRRRRRLQGKVFIERLGSIGIEGLPKSQYRLQLKRFKKFGFKRLGKWDTDLETLLMAIAQLPDTILNKVRGLTFYRDTIHDDGEHIGGEYNLIEDTIHMYNSAFSTSHTRFGTPGTAHGIHTKAVRKIIHEIGHAIDGRPLLSAMRKSGRSNTRARSVSGACWDKSSRTGNWVIKESCRHGRSNAFRRAAREDRPTSKSRAIFPTNYANIPLKLWKHNWWQDYFAESFSLYITNPTVLRQLRPNVFKYFRTNYPRR